MKKTSFALRTTLPLAVSLAALGAAPAWADTSFSLSGFGTLGVTHSDNREADFVANLYAPNGPGRSKSTSFGVDTKAGIQASADFGNGLTGILQVVADHRDDNTYGPRIEWANLKYQFTRDTYVRAGRVVAPVFMVSDYRNVGYALTPVRQPWDVYSVNPISHLDGADIGTRFDIGGGVLSGQLTSGRVLDRLYGARVSGHTTMANLNYERNASTLRAGYGKYKLDLVVNDPFFPSQLYADIVDSGIARQYLAYPDANVKLRDVDTRMLGIGYAYDPGTWLLQSEYVRRKSEGVLIQSVSAWYVLAGYRIGKFTPYASFSEMRSIQPPMSPAATVPMCAGVQPTDPLYTAMQCGDLAMAAYLINAVDAAANQRVIQRTTSLGMRYDFHRNLALKAQYERVHKPGSPGVPSTGQFVQPATGWAASWVEESKDVDLLTLALDFTF